MNYTLKTGNMYYTTKRRHSNHKRMNVGIKRNKNAMKVLLYIGFLVMIFFLTILGRMASDQIYEIITSLRTIPTLTEDEINWLIESKGIEGTEEYLREFDEKYKTNYLDGFNHEEVFSFNLESIDGVRSVYEFKTLEMTPINKINKVLRPKVLEEPKVVGNSTLTEMNTPDVFYQVDYSSFQPWMAYTKVTNKKSPAYAINNDDKAYTDENGLRRFKVSEGQFTIDGKDDYIVAMGTYYKPKGVVGQRFLIQTSMGSYTVITGDEKADKDTDPMNMISPHANGKWAVIEWIIDPDKLNPKVKSGGTVTKLDEFGGRIEKIYRIDE